MNVKHIIIFLLILVVLILFIKMITFNKDDKEEFCNLESGMNLSTVYNESNPIIGSIIVSEEQLCLGDCNNLQTEIPTIINNKNNSDINFFTNGGNINITNDSNKNNIYVDNQGELNIPGSLTVSMIAFPTSGDVYNTSSYATILYRRPYASFPASLVFNKNVIVKGNVMGETIYTKYGKFDNINSLGTLNLLANAYFRNLDGNPKGTLLVSTGQFGSADNT